jgi:polysaccharide biosynthesis protein PslG
MRTALSLVLISFLFSTCANRAAVNCEDSWAVAAGNQVSPLGFGVNIHFTDPQPGEIEMIAAAGFKWVRMDFVWAVTEKRRGVYDFSEYDRLMTALERHGLRALFILDYGNPLYTQEKAVRTEEARQAFARWAVAAAQRFGGRGVLWEVFNEPNVELFWPPRPNVDEYIALALAVGRSFRAHAPNEKLIGPATNGIDFPFLESCFKAGLLEYWSAVSVHPYRQLGPETAVAEYCRLRQLIEMYRPKRDGNQTIPIIAGEWGYSSVWRGMSEALQAQKLAREFLTNSANNVPLTIWYDWHDDGADPAEVEHHFGLVGHAYHSGVDPVYQPKPAYLAAKTFLQFFAGYSFQRRLAVGSDDDFVLVFSNGKEQRLAAWTNARVHRITISLEPGSYRVTKHTGEAAGDLRTTRDGLVLELSASPLYLQRQ